MWVSEGGMIETEMLEGLQVLAIVHIWDFEWVTEKVIGREELKELKSQSIRRIMCVDVEIIKI